MARSAPRMTAATQEILAALLASPSTPLYGFQIAQATDLSVGTVYPVLQRLRDEGWVVDHREDREIAEQEGRPQRRYYKLTDQGRTRAHNALQAAEERRARAFRALRAQGGLT